MENENGVRGHNQSIIPSTDGTQLTLTLKMTTAQGVETSVTVTNISPIQDFVRPDDQTQPTYEMTPGFKPFTVLLLFPGFWNLYCYLLLLLLEGGTIGRPYRSGKRLLL